MNLTPIGTTGRPHGTRGHLSLHIEEIYVEDLLRAKALLIGDPAIPYFVERFAEGGKLTVQLETFTTREQVVLLANQPVHLPTDQLSVEPEEENTPWDHLLDLTIIAEGYPAMGPIIDIMDLPEHYLAAIEYEGKTVYLPLHADLVVDVISERREVIMDLPQGLLEL